MKPQIAIEISEKYLKMAALGPVPAPQLPAPLELMVVPISNFTDKQITDAIISSLAKAKLKLKTAVLCVPRNMATVKNLRLPSQNPKEIEQMLSLHIGRLVPYKKEDILFGYEFLGVDTIGYADELLAIVRRDSVKRYYGIIEAAGISVEKITLSSHGAWHWALANFKQEVTKKDLYLLLDIDWAFTDLMIFNSDYLIFSRNITAEIGEEGFKQNEIAKLINEVKQSLIIFYNEALNKRPTAIYLSGSEAVSALRGRIESEFDIPVKYVPTPRSRAALKSHAAGIPGNVSVNAISEIVLEGKGDNISFMLPEMQIKRSFKEKARELIMLGSLCIYLFVAVFMILLSDIYFKQAYLGKLQSQNALIKESVGTIMDKAKKIEVAKEVVRSRTTPLVLFSSLQKLTPQSIAVNYISLDEQNNVILRGQGAQLSDVFQFIGALDKSAYFKSATAKYTRTKKVKDREVTDFEIDLTAVI